MKTTKKVLSGILWLGRGAATMMGLVVILALVLGVATSALAGTGVGATFDLGRTNTVDAMSRLVGSTNNALLKIENDDGGDLGDGPGTAGRAGPGAHEGRLKHQGGGVSTRTRSTARAQARSWEPTTRPPTRPIADFADKAAGATFADGAEEAEHAAKADDAAHAVQADRATGADANKVDGLNADEIGVNGWLREEKESASNSVSPKTVTAHCPSGKVVVGTGYDIVGGKNDSGKETDIVVDAVTPRIYERRSDRNRGDSGTAPTGRCTPSRSAPSGRFETGHP